MTRKKVILMMVCIIFFLSSPLYGGVVASAQPGDASDPVVTKAYVDAQISALKVWVNGLSTAPASVSAPAGETAPPPADADAVTTAVLAQIDALYGDILRQAALDQNDTLPDYTEPAVDTPASVEYEVVFMPMNQMLIAYAGAEIILRGGAAVAVTGENGLVDITAGADIGSGAAVPMNHLLLAPASDGRGLRTTSDSYLMIKGGYYIVE